MSERPTVLRPASLTTASVTDLRGRRGLPRLPRAYTEPRAVQRLLDDELPPVLVLQAPRAFGKTAAMSWLLRQEASQQYEHVWVTPQHREVTPEELWETVARRLRDAGLDDSDWTSLNRSLTRRRRGLVVVVDDLDRMPQSVDDELAELATNHDRLHIVTMTRRTRPIELLATQLDGLVLHADDLRLGEAEVARMAVALGHKPDRSAVAELTRQARGWPGLLRVVLDEPLQLRAGELLIDQHVVDRFLRIQLAEVADDRTRRLLQILSVPERLPDELAFQLVGQGGRDRVAAFLADFGLAEAAVRARATGPDPIRAACAGMLAEDAPDTFRDVSLRVARWYDFHGQPALALRHAVAAEDWDLVAGLLTRHWSALLADAPGLARIALDRLPEVMVSSSARLLVARDYILNIATDGRARAAFTAGLLVPDGVARARSGRRLSLRQVLTLRSTGLYEAAHPLVEQRDLAEAIEVSGWSPEVVAAIPELLLEWATANLLANPGVSSTYAFCEAATWAEHLGAVSLWRDAAAGAALSHVLIGYPAAAQEWLALVERLPPSPRSAFAAAVIPLAAALVDLEHLRPPRTDLSAVEVPPELGDLEVLVLKLRADGLLAEGRVAEAVRLLEGYRIQPRESDVASLAEHVLVDTLVEAYLSDSHVERARRLLLDVDSPATVHRASWALVAFQSGEYDQVLAQGSDQGADLMPQQTLQLSLLGACAALRLQQRPVAVDAFQNAVSTATQTGMIRPFALVPRADVDELAGGDVQVAELLAPLRDHRPLLAEPQDGSGISPRELQVLEAVSSGASFAAVASRLFVSPNTVKSQMRDIYRKLGVRGRDHAVARARELGLLRR